MEKWSGKPVSFADSTITGGFWKTEQDLCRKVTVNAVYDRFEETGRFEALKMQWKKGMPNQPHIFWESDVTKWIEGAAYFLKKEDGYYLVDNNSMNHTWLNGQQLVSNQPYAVKAGDVIRMADEEFELLPG